MMFFWWCSDHVPVPYRGSGVGGILSVCFLRCRACDEHVPAWRVFCLLFSFCWRGSADDAVYLLTCLACLPTISHRCTLFVKTGDHDAFITSSHLSALYYRDLSYVMSSCIWTLISLAEAGKGERKVAFMALLLCYGAISNGDVLLERLRSMHSIYILVAYWWAGKRALVQRYRDCAWLLYLLPSPRWVWPMAALLYVIYPAGCTIILFRK